MKVVSSKDQCVYVWKNANDPYDWIYSKKHDTEKSTFEEKYANISAPTEKEKLRIYGHVCPIAANPPKLNVEGQ